jgi:hypothetical protein
MRRLDGQPREASLDRTVRRAAGPLRGSAPSPSQRGVILVMADPENCIEHTASNSLILDNLCRYRIFL